MMVSPETVAALLPIAIVAMFAVAAALTDLLRREVPNVITIPLLMGGLLYHLAVGAWLGVHGGMWPSLGMSLAGAGLGFGMLLIPYLLGGMSAYDVKLMAAIGAWLGFQVTLYLFVVGACLTAIFGMVFSVRGETMEDFRFRIKILMFKMRNLGSYIEPASGPGSGTGDASTLPSSGPSRWNLLAKRCYSFMYYFMAEERLERMSEGETLAAARAGDDSNRTISFAVMMAFGILLTLAAAVYFWLTK